MGNTGFEPMAPPAICNCANNWEEDILNFILGGLFFVAIDEKNKNTPSLSLFKYKQLTRC